MSEMHIHINRPRNPEYVSRVRRSGAREWTLVGTHKTLERAAAAMARYLCASDYRFGDVLMTTNDYYDPVVLLECKRR